MSRTEVERCVWEVHRGDHGDAFHTDRMAYLEGYDLTDEERQALLNNDYGALYASGVHPMAVLFFSQINQTPMPEYLRAIGSSEERVEQFSALMKPR